MTSEPGHNAASPPAIVGRPLGCLGEVFRSGTVTESLGFYLPAAVLYRALGLIRGVLLAWLISKREFGIFQIILLAINILVPLCAAGLNEAVARYAPQYETRHSLRAFLGRAIPFALLLGAALSAIVFLLAAPLSRLLFATFGHGQPEAGLADSRIPLVHLATATTLVLIAYILILALVRGLRMFLAVSLMELISNLLFTLLAVLTALAGQESAEAIMVCYAASYLVTLAVFGLPLWSLVRAMPDQGRPLDSEAGGSGSAALLGRMLSYSLWSAMAAVAWQLVQYYPMWFLQKVHGPEVVAVCGGIHLITQAVLIAATSVVMVIQPTVTKTWEALGRDLANRQLLLAHKVTLLATLFICALLDLAAPWLVRLFPVGYAAGEGIIPLSLTFFMVAGQVVFLGVHFSLIERTRYQFVVWLVAVLSNAFFAARFIRPELLPDQALSATVWSELLGITAALAVTLLILRMERQPFDRGLTLLILAGYGLILPALALLAVILGVVLLAGVTNVVFDRREKVEARIHLAVIRAGILSRLGRLTSGPPSQE
ncbi:MAG TPA: oligosaccharide flippase family protein [Phycisphaerae bacterium]|nr:oligosaccharide flippase family protein [Phycisphaerae bacterium]HRY71024.1 oligosaccharide flippase family protein [Phycisphaerae bacterium]HSA29364.1 oligosaccharide flippase family protein [Phycisphaerae bacterium]